MKTAHLITFAQTVRIICEGEEPNDKELDFALIKAVDVMKHNGVFDTLDKCEKDTECPYGAFESDK